jgi:heat-inducible transcriptional repressor
MYRAVQKRPAKDEREKRVLLGLVELYLETGKPIGSDTLRENGFESLSAATIRNYFVKLEKAGFLKQQHSSGGRIPTEQSYKLYVQNQLGSPLLKEKESDFLRTKLSKETREVASYLERAAEQVSQATGCAVFLSSPRFDQDLLLDIKLVEIDPQRCLCILVTDFGLVHTELLYADKGLAQIDLKKVADYLQWRISGLDRPELSEEEERLAAQFYREIMLRHIVSHSNFSTEDLYRTGFSRLLTYPDFNDAAALASGLALFENESDLREALKRSALSGQLCCWLGDDLDFLSTELPGCSLILIPYRIHQTIAGAIGIMGPQRMPYRRLFGLMKTAADAISDTLTRSLYKFKIAFRQPKAMQIGLAGHALFIEDKSLSPKF